MDTNTMAPYRTLLIALLEQAIKDLRSGNPEVQRAAVRWLRQDTFSEEVCDWLGYNREAIWEALENQMVAS